MKITKDELHQLEIRLSCNIELLKNLERNILFENQTTANLSENEDEKVSFWDVVLDLEDIRQELDIL